MITLKQQTVSGIKWLVGSSFLQKAIQLAGTVILARILGPSQFGLFALAFVAIDALSLFRSMGFDSALIQRKDDIEKAANTAFFIIPVLGILLYLALFISAPLIGKFLNSQEVVGVVRALGIIFVISCLGRVPAALMEKHMQFKQVSLIEVTTAILYSTCAVSFAFLKFGVWSLVYAYILKTIYQNSLTFIYAKWWPRFEFDKKIALEMFHFGKFIFFGAVVWFLKSNLDNFLVGKILGITALGYYALAFNIAYFGLTFFGDKVNRVVFPAFSKLQNDKNAIRNIFLKTTKLVCTFAFPYFLLIFLLGDKVVLMIYGEKWIAMVPVLRILAIGGMLNLVTIALTPLYYSSGHSKPAFWFTFIQVILYLFLITPLARSGGLIAVSVLVVSSQLIAVVIFLPFTLKISASNLIDIIISMKSDFVASIVTCLGLIIGKFVIREFSGTLFNSLYIQFPILLSIMVTVYILTLRIIDKQYLKELQHIILNKSKVENFATILR